MSSEMSLENMRSLLVELMEQNEALGKEIADHQDVVEHYKGVKLLAPSVQEHYAYHYNEAQRKERHWESRQHTIKRLEKAIKEKD